MYIDKKADHVRIKFSTHKSSIKSTARDIILLEYVTIEQ